jgi:hypothetical protein
MQSMSVETKDHARLAVCTLRSLSTKKPPWLVASNLIFDDESPTNVTGVELVEARVESAVPNAWILKLTLRQSVVHTKEVERDSSANRNTQR